MQQLMCPILFRQFFPIHSNSKIHMDKMRKVPKSLKSWGKFLKHIIQAKFLIFKSYPSRLFGKIKKLIDATL